jgi:hypothetical protein
VPHSPLTSLHTRCSCGGAPFLLCTHAWNLLKSSLLAVRLDRFLPLLKSLPSSLKTKLILEAAIDQFSLSFSLAFLTFLSHLISVSLHFLSVLLFVLADLTLNRNLRFFWILPLRS